jgi:CBS domain containing-hemolysin-like protein
VWLGFLWLPSARLTSFSIRLARVVTPAINWFLSMFYPILRRITGFARMHRYLHVHTGLYEKEDLIELLDAQAALPDNRIPTGEIELLKHSLSFGDKLVSTVMVPLRAVRVINEDEPTGPKMMDELYQSGHSRFPVYAEEKTHIIGTLFLRDLVRNQASGHVKDLMRKDVFYIHEDFTLFQALQAFLKTKHHLFIVVNSFEEFVGILTIEDILEQMIGKQIVDEFDKYDNMRAVAALAAHAEHHERKDAEVEPTDGQADLEVVE